MAGSYGHCRSKKSGKFTFDLIDNMGDAHEACQMMFAMINLLAGGDNEKIEAAERAYHYGRKRVDGGDDEDGGMEGRVGALERRIAILERARMIDVAQS